MFQYGSRDSPSQDVLMRSPLPQYALGRRGSEPYYVNVPCIGLKGVERDEADDRDWKLNDGNYPFDNGDGGISDELIVNEHAEVFEESSNLLNERATAKRKLYFLHWS